MNSLWSLGGLSWRQLLHRAWRESWQDEVFGQAGRLAFYHFLALFPALLLLLLILHAFAGAGVELRRVLVDSFGQVLPRDAAALVAETVADLGRRAGSTGAGAWLAVLGALWAALNGTWAMMVGLNKAYEVQEDRPGWKIVLTAAVLTLALALLGMAALALILFAGRAGQALGIERGPAFLWRVAHWPVVAALLLAAFALLYRFGPNLRDAELRWSTPGAVAAMALWIGLTLLFREYFTHFNSYGRIYGPLAAVAMLLLWFYLTSASILFGGEMNSEIEKEASGGRRQPRK